jgi:hypothetical protein
MNLLRWALHRDWTLVPTSCSLCWPSTVDVVYVCLEVGGGGG